VWGDLKGIKAEGMMINGSGVGHGEARGLYFGPERRNGQESIVMIGCAGREEETG
jgi:hypothetical protein